MRIAALIAAGLLALGAAVMPAMAQETWPTKPVRVIVPYAPGGATDAIARPWVEKLAQAFGQPFVIDNKGGATGQIGTEMVAKSPPDGHTLLLAPNSALVIVPNIRKTPYDPFVDLVSVARVGDMVCGFALHPSISATSLPDLIAHAKANPGKVHYGSGGLGTGTHFRIEMLKLRTGADITHVPYRGSAEALNDLLGGHIQMMNEIVALPHVKAGKLKLLAVNYPTRHWDFPDVPTLTELGYPDSDVPVWYAIWAPKGTPEAIVKRLNAEIVAQAQTPEMQARMRDISVVVPMQTPAEMEATMRKDFAGIAALIKEARITVD